MNSDEILKKYLAHEMFVDRDIKRFDDHGMDGDTPLHLAAYIGHSDDVAIMANEIDSVDVRGGIGNTPLHLAILGGHAHVVNTLLLFGANIDAKNDYGDTPIDFLRINADEVMSVLKRHLRNP